MRCLVTGARPYDREFLDKANAGRHDLVFVEPNLLPPDNMHHLVR